MTANELTTSGAAVHQTTKATELGAAPGAAHTLSVADAVRAYRELIHRTIDLIHKAIDARPPHSSGTTERVVAKRAVLALANTSTVDDDTARELTGRMIAIAAGAAEAADAYFDSDLAYELAMIYRAAVHEIGPEFTFHQL